MASPVEINRSDFLHEKWTYEPGQHVLTIAPTGGGKSYLMWQLLGEAMAQNPGLSVVTYMPKPQDPTTVHYAEKLNLRETPVWPPKKKFLDSNKPDGHVLWPPHPQGVPTEVRRAAVGEVLKKGLEAQYWAGNSISFVDDAHSAAAQFDLNPLVEEILTNGRAGGAGMWLATQKPSGTKVSGGLTTFAYNSASKMFMGLDYDQRNMDRLGEIGGVDPKQIAQWIRGLRTFRVNGHAVTEWLYLDKSGPYYARILPW
jgi:hypothetical protein